MKHPIMASLLVLGVSEACCMAVAYAYTNKVLDSLVLGTIFNIAIICFSYSPRVPVRIMEDHKHYK